MTDKSAGEALLDRIGLRFQSGNSVPVERATITRAEYEALRASPQPSEPAAPIRCEVCGHTPCRWHVPCGTRAKRASAAPVAAGSEFHEDAENVLDRFYWMLSPDAKGKHSVADLSVKAVIRLCEKILASTAHPEPAAAEPVAPSAEMVHEVCDVLMYRQPKGCLKCERETATPYGVGIRGCWALSEQVIGIVRKYGSASAPSSELQAKVAPWMQECFGPVISADKLERSDRFIEEALELVQACGYERERAHALVEYVFNRPVGEPSQEVGGVMVTLAALCLAHGMDMHAAGETEVRRISAPDVIAKIRAKQASKPTGSALPKPSEGPARVTEAMVEALRDSLWSTWGKDRQTTDWPSWNDMRAALEAALAAAEGKGNG